MLAKPISSTEGRISLNAGLTNPGKVCPSLVDMGKPFVTIGRIWSMRLSGISTEYGYYGPIFSLVENAGIILSACSLDLLDARPRFFRGGGSLFPSRLLLPQCR